MAVKMKKTTLLTVIVLIFNTVLLVFNGSAQYTRLLAFDSINGSGPAGSLISDGIFLYGMTSAGGTNNYGTIFKIKPDGTGYTNLLNFTGANGYGPNSDLFSDGTFLYGLTSTGGTNNNGVIIKIKSDGTGYLKLHDFGNSTDGSNPYGVLISDGTFLYGMTGYGGVNNMGIIFKIKPDGTGYSKLIDFDGSAYGRWPLGSLTSDGTFLYGMTNFGGISDNGVIFKIKFDGTGYSKLIDFDGSAYGRWPLGSLTSDGTFLYGMTNFGGISDNGVIFKIKFDGTGFVNLLDFAGTNGRGPRGSLISVDSFLYGMTTFGGTSDDGVLFKIKKDGTGYSKLIDFIDSTNGSRPNGSLIYDGSFLYGMTREGGTFGDGIIFKIKSNGSEFSKLYNFTSAVNGSEPNGSLISDGNFLFGMTSRGGFSSTCLLARCGTLFKIGIATGITENNKSAIGFNIFPNPSKGTFTIAAKENNYTLSITNILGESIYKSEIKNQKTEVDLSLQPNGIYFINIQTEKESNTQKIIINK